MFTMVSLSQVLSERPRGVHSIKMSFAELCVNSTASADKQYIFAKYSVLAVKFLQILGGCNTLTTPAPHNVGGCNPPNPCGSYTHGEGFNKTTRLCWM